MSALREVTLSPCCGKLRTSRATGTGRPSLTVRAQGHVLSANDHQRGSGRLASDFLLWLFSSGSGTDRQFAAVHHSVSR